MSAQRSGFPSLNPPTLPTLTPVETTEDLRYEIPVWATVRPRFKPPWQSEGPGRQYGHEAPGSNIAEGIHDVSVTQAPEEQGETEVRVVVRNLPKHLDERTFQSFFQDSNRFERELQIKRIELEKDHAIVTFSNHADSVAVLSLRKKKCKWLGKCLKFEILKEESDTNDSESDQSDGEEEEEEEKEVKEEQILDTSKKKKGLEKKSNKSKLAKAEADGKLGEETEEEEQEEKEDTDEDEEEIEEEDDTIEYKGKEKEKRQKKNDIKVDIKEKKGTSGKDSKKAKKTKAIGDKEAEKGKRNAHGSPKSGKQQKGAAKGTNTKTKKGPHVDREYEDVPEDEEHEETEEEQKEGSDEEVDELEAEENSRFKGKERGKDGKKAKRPKQTGEKLEGRGIRNTLGSAKSGKSKKNGAAKESNAKAKRDQYKASSDEEDQEEDGDEEEEVEEKEEEVEEEEESGDEDVVKKGQATDDDGCTIQVVGIAEKTRDENVELYFENRRSGGGDIASFSRDGSSAIITFCKPEVARRVLGTPSLQLDGVELRVHPYVVSKTDILITGLPDIADPNEDLTAQKLELFIEAKLHRDVQTTMFNEDQTRALVQFQDEIDIETVKKALDKYRFKGVHLTARQMSVTRTALITNIPDKSSEDLFTFFFENQRNGGASVENVEIYNEDGYCLVTFETVEDLAVVLEKQPHTISSKTLRLAPYHLDLGSPFIEDGANISLPNPVTLDESLVEKDKLKFLSRVPIVKEDLNQLLQPHQAELRDGETLQVECTMTRKEKRFKQLVKSWTPNIKGILKMFMGNILVKKETFDDEEEWTQVESHLKDLHIDDHSAQRLTLSKAHQTYTLIIVGYKQAVEAALPSFKALYKRAREEVETRRQRVSEQVEIKRWQISYLQHLNFGTSEDEEDEDIENVQVDLCEEDCKVTFTGPRSNVLSAQKKMYEHFTAAKRQKLKLSSLELKLLTTDEGSSFIQKLLKRQGLCRAWEIQANTVYLYSDKIQETTLMENAIRNAFRKFSFKLDKKQNFESSLKSSLYSMTNQFKGGVVFSMEGSHLEVLTTQDKIDQVTRDLHQFMTEHTKFTEDVNVDQMAAQFLKRFRKQDILSKTKNIKKAELKWDKNDKMIVEGTRNAVEDIKKIIQREAEKVIKDDMTLKVPSVQYYLATEKGKDCLKTVEKTQCCLIHIKDRRTRPNAMSAAKRISEPPNLCAEVSLGNITLKVVQGDLTAVHADMLVNTSNPEMRHKGGLAKAFIDGGGWNVQKECQDRVEKQGKLTPGEVFVSGPGRLNCKAIAHALAARWSGGNNGEVDALSNAVEMCLQEATRRKHRSIAFPALATGMYGFPVRDSCLTITKQVKRFLEQGQSSINEVYFCDLVPTTVQAFVTSVKECWANTNVFDVGLPSKTEPGASAADASPTSKAGISVGKAQISVVKGELAKQKTDVIVNSTSKDLQLHRGKSSGALAKVAGSRLQEECEGKQVEPGHVFVTSGYNLQCQKVFHVALPRWTYESNALQIMQQTIEICLQKAEEMGFSSLTFPALGAGDQRYPKDKVVEIMFSTVSRYCQNYPGCLRSVQFVVYPGDTETCEAFFRGPGQKPETRGSTSPGQSASVEARVIKQERGKVKLQIGNLEVFVLQGDITNESTDGIVASGNRDLDLSKGAVTKAIQKKGGDAVVKDCHRLVDQMKEKQMVVTCAGKLKCKHIIFLDVRRQSWDWKRPVKDALRAAEQRQMTSLAFPALGTSVGCDAEDIGKVMFTALVEVHKELRSVRTVRFIIYDDQQLIAFIRGITSRVNECVETGDHWQARGRQEPSSADTVDLVLYSDSQEQIKRAKKALRTIIDSEWWTKPMQDESIKHFGKSQLQKIQDLGRKNNCKIILDHVGEGMIGLHGLPQDIGKVKDEIHSMIRALESHKHKREFGSYIAKEVRWFYLKGNKQFPFPSTVNLEIETAYRKQNKDVEVNDTSGGKYKIDFTNMVEVDLKNRNQTFQVVRRDLIKAASSGIPKSWATMGDNRNMIEVDLSANDKEYTDVVQEFAQSLGRQPKIIKIQRIQNKALYTQYQAKKRQIESQNGKGTKNERVLWHGTAASSVPSINNHGFNRSYCGKHGVAIGNGVYFAVSATYSDGGYASPDVMGHKRMYRCLVLTGDACQGRGGMRVPPPKGGGQSHILYDSVTDSPRNPSMFVIFNDTQAYPEHLITYQ